jgi:hypothetical protein
MIQESSPTTPESFPNRWAPAIFACLAIVALLLCVHVTSRWNTASAHPFRIVETNSSWITTDPSAYSGHFRKRFDVSGHVRHAWLKIAADEGFEVTVNRNPIGRHYLWRPTRPFQTGTSEVGQRLFHEKSAMALNYPREYQWTGHESWRLPTYLDITNQLQLGKNVICVEVESRKAPACVSFEGEITL